MQSLEDLVSNYSHIKASSLKGRYITNDSILQLIKTLPKAFSVETLGYSEQQRPIYGLRVGTGTTKVMIWSQMHGNESTCTKALFDVFNFLVEKDYQPILTKCALLIIPILNPDGAAAYTRHNANNVDLNRDAVNLTQKESKVLRSVFDSFRPDFGFNMHDQRTLFSVGQSNKPATVSFLSPAQDDSCSLSANRLRAMSLIHQMNKVLQQLVPGQVGRFDDAFNINCVGDYFQAQNVATVLFEAGHYQNDYNREETRKLIAISILKALSSIGSSDFSENDYSSYSAIPENRKLFFDVLLKNVAVVLENEHETNIDVGVRYEEALEDGKILFTPKLISKGDLSAYFGHRTIDLQSRSLDSSAEARELLGIGFCDIFTKRH